MERFRKKIAKGWLSTIFSPSYSTFCSSMMLLMLMLFSSSISALTTIEKAESSFQNGIKAFKEGNYSVAESFFIEAKNHGFTGLQNDYNLGVVTFKQKKYEQSILYFDKLVSRPQFTALAQYNIGLSLERQGKISEAKKYFKLAANDTSNEKIQYLAKKKLDEKEQKSSSALYQSDKNWDIYASVTYGYDDNVKLVAQDIASGKGDSYLQSYARGRYKTPIDVRIYVSIFDINYEDFDIENYRINKVGIDYPFKFNDWKITPAFEYSESELGDEDYQDITDYRLKARKRLGKNSLTLSYRYSDIDAADNKYNYLEGNRQRLRINYRMPIDIGLLRFRYQFETNDRKDTTFRSYSPDRHSIEAKLAHTFEKNWEFYADGSYRYSDYPTENGIKREEDRYRFSVGAEYVLHKNWSISAGYEYTDNKAKHSIDDYVRNVYQLSINGKF